MSANAQETSSRPENKCLNMSIRIIGQGLWKRSQCQGRMSEGVREESVRPSYTPPLPDVSEDFVQAILLGLLIYEVRMTRNTCFRASCGGLLHRTPAMNALSQHPCLAYLPPPLMLDFAM